MARRPLAAAGQGASSSPLGEAEGTAPCQQERVGILSRTLSPSPTIRWILPARLRSRYKNDVAFVGETYVQLREFLDNGQLADASAKLNFGTQILAAKVISAKAEVISVLDAILGQERDQERYTLRGEPIDDLLPPQILVLSTAANELVYMYAKDVDVTDVRFIFAKRPYLAGVAIPERYGRHLAVDSESRALAIAPSVGFCAVYKLRPVDELKSEIDSFNPRKPDSFQPSDEYRFIQVDGFILKMEFLRSNAADPSKVILLLLISNAGETRLLLYRWDVDQPLYTMRPMRCSGQKLPPEDCFPLMVIPSSRFSSFIIVTESALVFYDNILSPQAKRISFPLPKENHPRTSPDETPLWVQWAKPKRHNGHLERRDDLVLIREDGLLRTYFISYTSPMKVEAHFSPGSIGIRVDTAFCMLAGPPDKGGDVIVAGGDMTDGGVFHVTARGVPVRTQTLPNLAPLHDMILVPRGNALRSRTTAEVSTRTCLSDRVYICGGRTEDSGTVTEVRFGLEAQLGWTMAHPDAGTANQLWSLEDEVNKELLLLASHPVYTSLVRFDLETQELEFADSESCPGLDFDTPTLAAATIISTAVIQVTATSINIAPFDGRAKPVSQPHAAVKCCCACVLATGNTIAAANSTSTGFELAVTSVVTLGNGEYAFGTESTPLSDEPVSVGVVRIQSMELLVVGTSQATLLGFILVPGAGLAPAFRHQLGELESPSQISAVCSLSGLSHQGSQLALLLCGLRNGALVCVELQVGAEAEPVKIHIKTQSIYQIGSTSVHVSKEDLAAGRGYASSALVLCQADLRRVTLHKNESGADYSISTLWITSHNTLSFSQPLIHAVHRISQLQSTGGAEPSSLLICATQDEILFTSLLTQEQAILNRVPTQGVTRRIAYSSFLNKVVAAVEAKHSTLDQDGPKLPSIEYLQTGLELFDLDMTMATGEGSVAHVLGVSEPGERVRALMNWSPTDGKQHFEMVVLALDHQDPETKKRSGRVVCVSAKGMSKGLFTAAPKTVIKLQEKSPSALCAFGLSSMIIAADSEIILHHLDFKTRKWETLDRYTLPSPATSVTAQGSLIFVATALHSLLILKEHKKSLNLRGSDSRARNTNNVVTVDSAFSLVAALSDRGTTLIAFPDYNMQHAPELFEANVPLMVDRVRQDRAVASRAANRYQFHGSTTDGTLYHFMTLKQNEWKLLHFLEGLCEFKERKTPRWLPLQFHHPEARMTQMQQPPFIPSEMHVHGDMLINMLGPGPYGLHNLLAPEVKQESSRSHDADEAFTTFQSLAEEVVGPADDMMGAVTIWLRRLLRYPAL